MSAEGVPARHARGGAGPEPPDRGQLRIGEAARLVGVSPSALRLWERQGLVRPQRTRAGYRVYRDADIEQLRRIQRMRDEHVSAPGIRRLIPVPGGDGHARHGRVVQGRRIRSLRTERGLSLREASRRTGLSVSFLSAIERDATGVSVATLHRLTEAYGVTMLDLFDGRQAVGRRIRPADRPTLDLDGSGVRIEQLALGSAQLEPQLFLLAPGATSEGEYAHAGEEFLYVLDGEVTFWIGADERYRLRTGDALTFPSNLPHRWRNRAGGETRLLWINTPPTF